MGGTLLGLPLVGVSAESLDVEISTPPRILITEIQTNGLSADSEFIELYNAGEEPVDLSYISLQRATASSTLETSWSQLALVQPFTGFVAPKAFIMVAHKDYTDFISDYRFSGSNLSNTGGHLRIVWDNPATEEVIENLELDKIGWGTAAMPEGLAAPAAASGSSVQRCMLETGEFDDTDNNATDFKEFTETTPAAASSDCSPSVEESPEVTDPDAIDESADSDVDSLPAENEEPAPEEVIVLLPLQITELLPNPASPTTDAEGEFLEIYNPNDTPVDLDGWHIETGSSFSYRVFLDRVIVPSNGYITISSATTSLTLSNSGGAARLLDDTNQLVSQTDVYDKASDGQSWIFIAGTWQWTTTPTPDLPNILTLPTVAAVKSVSKKTTKKATKKAASKKTAAKKPTSKVPKAAVARDIFEDPLSDGRIMPISPSILAVVGLGALGYSLYEYRYDARNRIEQLRRHRAARRAARPKT